MLDQIEQLIHGVRNVSNSIAHDLRTPLAELRSRLEELSLTRPPPEETFAEIEAAVADVDRVIRIFNALLRLAEIDYRHAPLRLRARRRRRGRRRGRGVLRAGRGAEGRRALVRDRRAGAAVAGDPVLLAQAVGNLIDNALKYVAEHGAIRVRVGQRRDGAVEIAVADDGPGIPDAEKPKVTERFYRGDASRGTPGVGLGLSLVDAVAKLHGGALQLLDNHPGLRAQMVLPLAA